jgi:DNA repair exonuclease SbcCD ATPase subunit
MPPVSGCGVQDHLQEERDAARQEVALLREQLTRLKQEQEEALDKAMDEQRALTEQNEERLRETIRRLEADLSDVEVGNENLVNQLQEEITLLREDLNSAHIARDEALSTTSVSTTTVTQMEERMEELHRFYKEQESRMSFALEQVRLASLPGKKGGGKVVGTGRATSSPLGFHGMHALRQAQSEVEMARRSSMDQQSASTLALQVCALAQGLSLTPPRTPSASPTPHFLC